MHQCVPCLPVQVRDLADPDDCRVGLQHCLPALGDAAGHLLAGGVAVSCVEVAGPRIQEESQGPVHCPPIHMGESRHHLVPPLHQVLKISAPLSLPMPATLADVSMCHTTQLEILGQAHECVHTRRAIAVRPPGPA